MFRKKKQEKKKIIGKKGVEDINIDELHKSYLLNLYSSISLSEFKNDIDNDIIVIFDNRDNLLNWMCNDCRISLFILKRLRDIDFKNYDNINTCIMDRVFSGGYYETEDYIMLDLCIVN